MVINELRFHHVVDIPSMDSQIATARDKKNKTHIYLIVNHNGPVYKRNGLNDTWDILEDSIQRSLRDLLEHASNRIAHYSTKATNV